MDILSQSTQKGYIEMGSTYDYYARPRDLVLDIKKRLESGKESMKWAWLNWEPETVWTELHRSGIDVDRLHDVVKDKILGSITLMTTTHIYWNVEFVNGICATFNELQHKPTDIIHCEPHQVGWAFHEARNLKDLYGKMFYPLDYEVRKYVAACFHEAGLVDLPEWLKECKEELDKLNTLHSIDDVKRSIGVEAARLQAERLKGIVDYVDIREGRKEKLIVV